jgi:hypothetical protein
MLNKYFTDIPFPPGTTPYHTLNNISTVYPENSDLFFIDTVCETELGSHTNQRRQFSACTLQRRHFSATPLQRNATTARGHNSAESLQRKTLQRILCCSGWFFGGVVEAVTQDWDKTNNGCEGFNRAFSSLLSAHHPNIWKFIQGLHGKQTLSEVIY